ncbi:MAG TPA: rRNA maturation RNase YbeY [Gaiellaceae bacterium]
MVEIEVANRSGEKLDLGAARELIRAVLAGDGIHEGEVGLQLVAPEEIRALKRVHLGIDEETDALAFPIDGSEPIPSGMPRQLGDVVLCPAVVGEAWRAPVVHAVLHLIGYDHGAEMEAREREHS